MQDDAMAELVERYRRRIPFEVELVEKVARGRRSGKDAEADLIESQIGSGDFVIALDERGRDLSSRDLATRMGRLRDEGRGTVSVIVGGADGLAERLRQRADMLLAFGRATWPHMLVRVMLMEQLYRASSILGGHPYHRD
ncbi:MAG: 23S rRNA (pseudouridine(1915)-N(3))-methyltransferase RlmH [Geminicoccaceae bacterium]|nr:23S rRNA (pseudouridine(1915)-N(3))-methyltransferase RlmH [Geminicoccaceae bacterium]